MAVVERVSPRVDGLPREQWPTTWKVPTRETLFLVRDLGRMVLGVRYTDQAYEIAKVCHDARCADPDGTLSLLLDCTGVGEGVGDILERYLPTNVSLRRCWFTATERVEVIRGELRVGKPFMVSRLTSLIETGRVRLGEHPQRQALVEELRDFEFKISAGGHYTADARSGAHDDMLTTLGLGCLLDGGGGLPPRYSGRPLDSPPRLSPDTDDWTVLHSQSGW